MVGLLLALLAVPLAAGGCQESSPSGFTGHGFYYESRGSGHPVILLHGFSLDSRMWDTQVGALASRYRVIRYDLRGHGKTTAPITVPFAAHEDLRDLMDDLGIRRATVVGLSMGARVAVDFALVYPERVAGLVLAGPGLSGYVATERPAGLDSVAAAIRAGDPRRAAEHFAETPLMAIPWRPDAHAAMKAIVVGNAHLWGLAGSPERPLDPPAIGRLSEIRVPLLLVVGEADTRDTHRVADTLATVSAAAKHVVPNAGHMVNMAAPERFNELLLEFVARHAP